MFSSAALVVAAYTSESKGGDGELITPIPLADYIWPDEIEAIVIVEPDEQAVRRIASLSVTVEEEQARAVGKPERTLGQPFALVADNCRDFGMGIEGEDFGNGTNAVLLGRTDRRIDVHAWEEILFRHFDMSEAKAKCGEDTDGWSDAAYAEVFAKYGGDYLPKPRRVTIDGRTRQVETPEG